MGSKETSKVDCHDWRKEDQIKLTWRETAFGLLGAALVVGGYVGVTFRKQIFNGDPWPPFRVERSEPSPMPAVSFPSHSP